MVESVETLFYIALDVPDGAGPVLVDVLKRRMTAPTWAKSVRMLAEDGVVIGFQDAPQHFCQEFVAPDWHPKRSEFSRLFGDVGPARGLPVITLLPQGGNDRLNFLQAHAVSGFLGDTGGHRACVPVDLPVGAQVMLPIEQLPIHALEGQSISASLVKKVQVHSGVLHCAYPCAVSTSRYLPCFPLSKGKLWPSFEGCPFAMC
jgi:hypothetical protein